MSEAVDLERRFGGIERLYGLTNFLYDRILWAICLDRILP